MKKQPVIDFAVVLLNKNHSKSSDLSLHGSLIGLQDPAGLQQENAKLKERCSVLEIEVQVLRLDMTALQRHLHLPVTFSAHIFDDDDLPISYKRNNTQVSLC